MINLQRWISSAAFASLVTSLLCFFVAGASQAASISVIEDAAHSGDRGMRIYMDEPHPGYVQDDTPNGNTQYRARFYLRTDELNLPAGKSLDILSGFDGAGNAEFIVRLVHIGGRIVLTSAISDNVNMLVGFGAAQQVPLYDGWHSCEIDWRAGAGTGRLDVYVDGSPKTSIASIANIAGSIQYVCFGAVTAPDIATRGFLDLDDFVYREADYIGLPPMTFPIQPIKVNMNAPNTVGSLIGYFLDYESGYFNLDYAVADVSNPGLFTSVSINSVANTIVIDYAPDKPGTSDITVRATDPDLLFADNTFTVIVNGPPTTTGIPAIEVDANAPNQVISLWDVFDDTEDADDQLSYSIASNTDTAGIFASTAIDLSAGTLTLVFAPDTPGTADITLLAVDTGGLQVSTTFTVTVKQLPFHSADTNQDNKLNLSELLRIIQFFNSGVSCAIPPSSTEDGFVPAIGGDHSCTPHNSDYNPQDWSISLTELLRVIQIFNSTGYTRCSGGEDGFCLS